MFDLGGLSIPHICVDCPEIFTQPLDGVAYFLCGGCRFFPCPPRAGGGCGASAAGGAAARTQQGRAQPDTSEAAADKARQAPEGTGRSPAAGGPGRGLTGREPARAASAAAMRSATARSRRRRPKKRKRGAAQRAERLRLRGGAAARSHGHTLGPAADGAQTGPLRQGKRGPHTGICAEPRKAPARARRAVLG